MNKLILVILFCGLSLNIYCNTNPRQWFDTQYTDALYQCTSNKALINKALMQCDIPVHEAISIVFPEMLRYSLWRDLFETTALQLLYVNRGSKAADFSIGWCQMKPSFAEKIEHYISGSDNLCLKYSDLVKFDVPNSDSAQIRKIRVTRLQLFKWQLRYLSAFIAICNHRFSHENIDTHDRLKLLSAAYNKGIDCDINDLKDFSKKKTFPYGPGRENPFAYSQVAEYFFVNDAPKIILTPN
ncbi:hypothetical protein LX69_02281 [Breznakibacter xylanolyticus]|uniref:Transglycosylase-like protein with SLT domain n=1 Tax=Breznakibacter xylanolyticus TaxID=990 RepID=A0A2W7N5F4_9BACT|nr:hypothetical protein [Breznakibacter xylanolyticus]PZX14953.1 hypothetical protein LX69_02281 [Breznakibacter xylanolyticus]